MKTTRVPPSHCHNCQRLLDAATNLGKAIPCKGDLTVCISCAAIHRYNEDLVLYPVTREELDSLDVETRAELWKVRKLILEMHNEN